MHKTKTGRANINFYNRDNIEFMKDIPDNYYDLAIVDPPYGIGQHKAAGKRKNSWQPYVNHEKKWDKEPPKQQYFNELFRVSKNQIIWGANYFVSNLPVSSNWIVWDKLQPEGLSFSMHELAFCSIKAQARIFTKSIEKNRATNKESAKKYERIHPTQKPVKLYEWLLTNYAKEGDKILDTHGGSGSISLACWNLGFDLDLCELDEDYFNDSWKRFEWHARQQQLF